MEFPQYISSTEKTISVEGVINDNEEFKDGKGYILSDGGIWIFCLNKPSKVCRNEYPYFWKGPNGLEFSNPSDSIRETYSFENLRDLSAKCIIRETEDNEQLFDEKEINDINSAASFYVPLLKRSDDFLKKTIKAGIIRSALDTNKLKSKTAKKYTVCNMRSVLENETKMSTKNFQRWMELMNCDFEIIIYDNGTGKSQLKHPVIYQSCRDSISEIINDELVDLNTGLFVMDQGEVTEDK